MKSFLTILYCALSLICFASTVPRLTAQETNESEKVLIDAKDLPADVLLKIKTKQKLAQYGEHAKWGHEIGIAVNETLAAVTTNTAAFAETKVGRMAMFLVAWKIMARDIMDTSNKVVGYCIGIPLWFFGSLVLIWSYRRLCMPRKYLQEVRPDKTKVYGTQLAVDERDLPGWALCHGVGFVVLCIICVLIIFT